MFKARVVGPDQKVMNEGLVVVVLSLSGVLPEGMRRL
jgi:hypothetical protein